MLEILIKNDLWTWISCSYEVNLVVIESGSGFNYMEGVKLHGKGKNGKKFKEIWIQ